MKKKQIVELYKSEIQSVSDILLFKSIIIDESDAVINVIKRFDLPRNHKLLGICEPIAYISQNFLEITNHQYRGYGNSSLKLASTLILEDNINNEFCKRGIHALELAIKIDALSTFHALLDIGHYDYSTQAVYLCIKYLRNDMLQRLAEEGFDLWLEHIDWESRPIDVLMTMISFQEELPFYRTPNINQLVVESLEILYENSPLYNFVKTKSKNSTNDLSPIIRKRKGLLIEIESVFLKMAHGLK
jgi:hypothetical protein